VITLPDDAAALAVAETVRQEAPSVPIVSRASTWDGARRLKSAGVVDVVRPELEGGVEIVRRTLLDLDLPGREVQRYVDVVRRDGLDEATPPSADQARVLGELIGSTRGVDVVWADVDPASEIAGLTIEAAALRARTGASIVAIAREGDVMVNPAPATVLTPGARAAVIGTTADIDHARALLAARP
jgi:CPA2 family monovalent cation:H+ antiporter-2